MSTTLVSEQRRLRARVRAEVERLLNELVEQDRGASGWLVVPGRLALDYPATIHVRPSETTPAGTVCVAAAGESGELPDPDWIVVLMGPGLRALRAEITHSDRQWFRKRVADRARPLPQGVATTTQQHVPIFGLSYPELDARTTFVQMHLDGDGDARNVYATYTICGEVPGPSEAQANSPHLQCTYGATKDSDCLWAWNLAAVDTPLPAPTTFLTPTYDFPTPRIRPREADGRAEPHTGTQALTRIVESACAGIARVATKIVSEASEAATLRQEIAALRTAHEVLVGQFAEVTLERDRLREELATALTALTPPTPRASTPRVWFKEPGDATTCDGRGLASDASVRRHLDFNDDVD